MRRCETSSQSAFFGAMLSHLIASLTIVATLLHSVLGCCWHHEHDVCKQRRTPVVSGHPGCPCHRHRPDARERQPCDEPDGDSEDLCHERSCVYVAVKHFELPAATSPDAMLAVRSTELTPTTIETGASPSLAISPPRPSAPELRALLQVWLI
jgi:hypothetical protein